MLSTVTTSHFEMNSSRYRAQQQAPPRQQQPQVPTHASTLRNHFQDRIF